MIIFKAFQGLENFYIKVQDFPYHTFPGSVRTLSILTSHQSQQLYDNVTQQLFIWRCRCSSSSSDEMAWTWQQEFSLGIAH